MAEVPKWDAAKLNLVSALDPLAFTYLTLTTPLPAEAAQLTITHRFPLSPYAVRATLRMPVAPGMVIV
jgi:hypothetical protein